MKIIITGASGMVGEGVLLECIASPEISAVLTLNRKPLSIEHPKVREVLVDDFFDLDDIRNELQGYDACFFCIGVSSIGMTEQAYSNITYDLTLHFARIFLELNNNSIFCFVSGAGTDSSEQGRSMWARVKGHTENALIAMPFKAVYAFRPGYIQPLKGIRSRHTVYTIFYGLFKPLYVLFRNFPGLVTDTTSIGKAMINVASAGFTKTILGNKDINLAAKKRHN